MYIRMVCSFNAKYVVIISLLCTLGFLTHYYAYIYIFFLTLFYIIYLFYRREYKRGVLYGLAILISVGVAVALYPAVLKHVLSSVYGKDIVHGSHPGELISFFDMLRLVLQSYTGVNVSLLYILPGILIVGYLLHLVVLLRRAWKQDCISNSYVGRLKGIGRFILEFDKCCLRTLYQKLGDSSWKLVLISVLAYSVIIVNVTPYVGVTTIRYLYVVLPLFSVFMVHYVDILLFSFLTKLEKKALAQVIILCALCAFSVLGSYVSSRYSNFLRNTDGMDMDYLNYFSKYPNFLRNTDSMSDYRKYFENSNIITVDLTPSTSIYTYALMPWLMNSMKVFPTDKIDASVTAILSDYDDRDVPLYFVVIAYYDKSKIDQYLSTVIPGRYSYMGAYHCSVDNFAYHLFYKIKEK